MERILNDGLGNVHEAPSGRPDSATLRPKKSEYFSGIEAKFEKGQAWTELAEQPIPAAIVKIVALGALWADAFYFDPAGLQKMAAQLMKLLDEFVKLLLLDGVEAKTLFAIDVNGAEVLIHSHFCRTNAQLDELKLSIITAVDRAWSTLKAIEGLARLPGKKFNDAWRKATEFSNRKELLFLLAAFSLGRFLSKHKLTLTVAGEVVRLPDRISVKTEKVVEVEVEVEGILRDLISSKNCIVVELQIGDLPVSLLTLAAKGKGYVESISQAFRVGDFVRIKYRPKIQLLKPHQSIPKQGILVDIF